MHPQRLKGSQVISINQFIIVFHISRLSREIGRCLFIFFNSEIMADTMNGIHMYYECETTTMNAMNGTNIMKRMSVRSASLSLRFLYKARNIRYTMWTQSFVATIFSFCNAGRTRDYRNLWRRSWIARTMDRPACKSVDQPTMRSFVTLIVRLLRWK